MKKILILLIGIVFISCGNKNEELANYARQISDDNQKLDKFFSNWTTAEKFKDEIEMKTYIEKVNKELIPTVDASVKYLETVKINDKNLQLVHAKNIKARKYLLESYQDFVKEITKENYNEKRDNLVKQLEIAKTKQEEFNTAFKSFCAEQKVEVKEDTPKDSGKGESKS
ncbi:MAG: hypothetical protein JXA60_06450 [Candidatus Coatesbacteria bacterium]|nr:hypothetical protein [Candidatus Coatesbacteria bacterium]